MGMRDIVHESRLHNFHLKFTANGQTTANIIANGDCEIYGAELVNVDSFQIQGSAPNFPINLSNGDERTVTIIKQTEGEVAEIKLLTRRANEVTQVINVPDYGAYDGRYLYLLFSTVNEVVKIDTDLLSVANYLGLGAWNINPVISTIALPVLPNDSVWRSITFVKNDGIGKMFIQGSTIAGNLEVYASYILDDDSVVDMEYLTATPYTLIRSGNLKISSKCCVYDFIQEKVYIALASIGNGSTTLVYDLVNKTSKENSLSSNSTYAISRSIIRSTQFIPHLSRFSYIADLNVDTEQYFNYKPAQNSGTRSSYASSLGYTERNVGTIKVKGYYDANGVHKFSVQVPVSPIGGAPSNLYSISESLTLDSLKSTFTIYRQSYSIANYDGGNSSSSDVIDFEDGAARLKSVMGSNRNNQFYALSDYSSSKRLFVFDPTQDPMQCAYLEFANDADQMHTNQLII